jgi:hypothetical protein
MTNQPSLCILLALLSVVLGAPQAAFAADSATAPRLGQYKVFSYGAAG